jgi:hypothetical protein
MVFNNWRPFLFNRVIYSQKKDPLLDSGPLASTKNITY